MKRFPSKFNLARALAVAALLPSATPLTAAEIAFNQPSWW